MGEAQRYLPDSTTQQVDCPEPQVPASTPEVIFGVDPKDLPQYSPAQDPDSFEIHLDFE